MRQPQELRTPQLRLIEADAAVLSPLSCMTSLAASWPPPVTTALGAGSTPLLAAGPRLLLADHSSPPRDLRLCCWVTP